MKTYKIQGKYEYEDNYKIENDDSYFNETLLWEADITFDGKINDVKIFNENHEEYDYTGKLVNDFDGSRTLYNHIKQLIENECNNDKNRKQHKKDYYKRLKENLTNENSLSLLTKNTFKNPLNPDENIVENDNNIGAFKISDSDGSMAIIDYMKKITNNGLTTVIKHLCNVADQYKITLYINQDKLKNKNMISWYKSYGFIIDDKELVRYPKD